MTEISLPVLNGAQMHEVQSLLVDGYGIAPLQTMENGGSNLARLAKMMLDGDLADRPIVLLAGRGNNGGGGLVAARQLYNWGAWVQIVCSHPPEEYDGIAAHQLRIVQAMGLPLAWAEEGWELPPCDLVVDAIVGCGLRGEPHGKVRDLIQLANSSVAPILSFGLPSGVDGESGELFTPHIRADATLTLALPQAGLLVDAARRECGELYLGDIGVPAALYEQVGIDVPPFFGIDPIVRWHVVEGSVQVLP